MVKKLKVDKDSFSLNLRQILERRGMTLSMLSDETGITLTSLSRYVNNQRTPEIKAVIKIAAALGTTVEWLYSCEDDFSSLPEDQQELVRLYNLASAEDRAVIMTLLSRYK